MADRSQVSIPDLLSISKQSLESFFPSSDIYSLLVLALITVTRYSREKHHLASHTRIDLTIEFLPDLITYLQDTKVITQDVANGLSAEIKSRQDELPLILQAYIYASGGLRTKMEPKLSDQSKCRCDVI